MRGTVWLLGDLYSCKVNTCYMKCSPFLIGMVGGLVHADHDDQTEGNEDTTHELGGGGGRGEQRGGLDKGLVLLTPNNPLKSPSGPIMDSWPFW